MKLSVNTLIAAVVLFASNALADLKRDVQITLPSQWKLSSSEASELIYRNQNSKKNEVVYASLVKLPTKSELTPGDLVDLKSSIAWMRERTLREYAINRYTIHSIETSTTRARDYLGVVTIEASYRGLAGQEVQLVERQYFASDKILQVVYSEESATLGDRARISFILDNFRPRSISQSASLLERWFSPTPVFAGETVGSGQGSSTPQKSGDGQADVPVAEIKKPDLTTDLCASVPQAEQRNESDKPISTKEFLGHCGEAAGAVMKSAGETLWNAQVSPRLGYYGVKDAIMGSANIVENTKREYEAVKRGLGKAYRWVTDSGFRAESNAKAIAKIEDIKRPILSAQHFVAGLWESFTKVDPPLVCYREDIQAKRFCSALTTLAGSLGGGKLLQIASKGAKGAEAAAVADALKKGATGAGKVDEKALAATAAKKEAAEGAGAAQGTAQGTAQGAGAAQGTAQGTTGATASAGQSTSSAGAAASETSGASRVERAAAAARDTDTTGMTRAEARAAKKDVLAISKEMTPEERVAATSAVVRSGEKLTEKEAAGLIKAHNRGAGKDYDELTPKDIADKARDLKEAGFKTREERRAIMQNGFAGGRSETIDFADNAAVAALERNAVNSAKPSVDGELAARAGKTKASEALHREAANRATPGVLKRDQSILGSDLGEYSRQVNRHLDPDAMTDKARSEVRERISSERQRINGVIKKYEAERDNTVKYQNADYSNVEPRSAMTVSKRGTAEDPRAQPVVEMKQKDTYGRESTEYYNYRIQQYQNALDELKTIEETIKPQNSLYRNRFD